MKRFIFLTVSALAISLLWSCGESGGTTDSDALLLSSSSATITANGTDKIEFTVTKAGENLTNTANIYMIVDGDNQKLEGTSFSTRKNGTYTFQARYEGEFSPAITIKASGEVPLVEKYYRNVCVFRATGTWCTACPAGGRQLDDLVDRVYPDRVIVMAFHGSATGYDPDPMTIPQTNTLFTLFPLMGGGYPSFVADIRKETACTGSSPVQKSIGDGIKKSLSNYPASCGIRIESKVADGKLDINVGVTSNSGGSYKLGVYVVENGLVYPNSPQIDAGYEYPEYMHNDVVRKMLTRFIPGESIGILDPDKEVIKQYSTEINTEWNLENLEIVVYAVDETETINNIAKCKANNGSVDYRLN